MEKDTLVIGSSGYIGSSILSTFQGRCSGLDVYEGRDIRIDYDKITKKTLSQFKNIILLAGNPNPASCNGHPKYSLNNNVVKFVKILHKINNKQKFIYASSSCVYDSKNGEIVDETCNNFIPLSYYDISKKVIDYYAELSNVEFYGLRFGSVNGLVDSSLIMRDDIIINSMTKNAIQDSIVNAVNPEIHRAILGISDLCRAIQSIIDGGDNRGIYNLASFNSTVGDIANFIGSKYNAKINTINSEAQKLYDFQVSSNKFSNTYNFQFNDSLDSITDSIYRNIKNVKFVRRSECIRN